jgi:hypothetical protein
MLREFWTSSKRKTKRALQGGRVKSGGAGSTVESFSSPLALAWGLLMLNGGSGSWSVGLLSLLLGLAMVVIGIFRSRTTDKEAR